ncbi:Cobalamin-binding protein OS=Streptomyces antimycoticus OX=68175 GN=SSPO_019260 PE=4 SV=1 [Streptomyces antimycoticus]
MRIGSLLPAATDIVAELGLAEHLVGRTHACDWPPRTVASVPLVTGADLDQNRHPRAQPGATHTGGRTGLPGHRR